MLTRCPHCATTFRITPEQLKARQGKVRCGQCQEVFNALETLVEEAPAATPAADVTPFAEPPVEAPLQPEAPEQTAELEAAVPPEPTFPEEPEPPEAVAAETATAADDNAADEPETLVDYEPSFDSLLVEEKPQRRWPWVLGALLALFGLALQALFHYRVELAVVAPELKPALLAACEALGCELPRPRKIDLIGIETSDLHPAAQPGLLQLAATLRNRAPFAQEYPHLELTLTDTADKAVLRRVLAPADYLAKDKPAARGFAANGELAVGLTLEAKGVPAAGYRLYVFYP